jgi:predicted metalloendopeptidase
MNSAFSKKLIVWSWCAGVTGDEEKWRTCISDTDSTIGFALGAMFVREAFHGESKTTVRIFGIILGALCLKEFAQF